MQVTESKTKIANGTFYDLTHHTVQVTTRIGQSFLHLIDTHFLKIHTFNKIFSRNKVKVSYSSMQNIKAIINNHNINIPHQNNKIKDECNCRNKKYFPLGVKCLLPNLAYQRKTTSTQPNCNGKVYIGVAEKSFKDSTTTPNPLLIKFNQMSKEYLEIKRNNFISKVTWNIVRECAPYNFSKRKCYLCLNEKLETNSYKGNNLLKKRSKLINTCRHLKKHTILWHDSKE